MQRPRAHITRQGPADTIRGATPIAVSQPQPSARPEPPTTSPVPASTRRFRIHDHTTSGGNEAVGQHDATAGPVMSADVGVVIVGAGVAFSTPSMIVVLSS